MKSRRTYDELMTMQTYEERLNYLRLFGSVGEETFGFDRYLNQKFYKSEEWKRLRRTILLRDSACDLALIGYDIVDARSAIIHHINPLTAEDIKNGSDALFDENNLITTSSWTHRLIHYGNEEIIKANLNRTPFDTCPWRK